MKKLLITSMIGLFPALIFAQEKPMNCDDLAAHIEYELRHEEANNFNLDSPNSGVLRVNYVYKDRFGVTDLYHMNCKEAGRLNATKVVDSIPSRIHLLKKYQSALQQCIASSETSCKLAQISLRELQDKIDTCSKCLDQFNEGKAAALEQRRKNDTFDKFINDANKK
jgi:hypothetical protein